MSSNEQDALPPTFTLGDPALTSARTYIVMGVSRGGTTMVAGVANRLGLDLGDGYGHTFEDPRFNLNELALHHAARADQIAAIRRSIAERNDEGEVWGWKFPNALRYLADVMSEVRRPHLVIVCRDTAAVVGRGRRANEDARTALVRTAQMNLKNMRLLRQFDVPGLVISYERALAQPLQFTRDLADYLGRDHPADTDWYESYISPGYKTLEVALSDQRGGAGPSQDPTRPGP